MVKNRFKYCLLGGAIGDAWGSGSENSPQEKEDTNLFYWGGEPEKIEPEWQLTDDTQLTLATIESIHKAGKISPDHIAKTFAEWFQKNRLSGLGSSTLKAIQELRAGGHWALVGRKGEYAAGNGAAMRIAPLAMKMKKIDRKLVRDVCRITHHNEEAYVGALAIMICLNRAFYHQWNGNKSIWNELIRELPDSVVRDRIMLAKNDFLNRSIIEFAQKNGASGYVAESVPLAIFSATKLGELGFEETLHQLIKAGGDTDTNCSMAGQIMGAIGEIPTILLDKLKMVDNYDWILKGIDKLPRN